MFQPICVPVILLTKVILAIVMKGQTVSRDTILWLCVCASRGQKTGQHFRQPLRCLERRVPWRAEAFFTDRTPRDFTVHAWMWFRLPSRENVWGFSPAPIFMKFSTSVYIFLCVEMFCTELYCNPAGKNVEDKRRMYVAPLSEVWLQLYRFSWNSQLLNTFFLCVEMFCTEFYCNPAKKNVQDKRQMYVAPLG